LGDIFNSLTGTWVDILHPTFAGFYVPLLLAILAGVLDARVRCPDGERVQYRLEHFVVGSELCLGSLSIVLIAYMQIAFALKGELLAALVFSPLLVPMLVLNVYALALALAARKSSIQRAQSSSADHKLSRRGTSGPIQPLEVFVSLAVCAALVGVNTMLFQSIKI
jgi:hypothetical protein